MKIRPATLRDTAALSELGAATFAGTFQSLYKRKDLLAFLAEWHSVDYYTQALSDPDITIWVIEDEKGRLQGYCKVGPNHLPCEPPYPNALELSRLYMRDTCQSGGWGSKLMEQVFSYAKAQGISEITLSVYSDNLAGQRFYARHGFTKIGDYEFKVGGHYDQEYIFHKTL